MKAIFIIFNQVLSEEVLEMLNKLELRGFTKFNDLQGRGSETGDPHMGSHTWPSLNNAVLIITEEKMINKVFEAIDEINKEMEEQGVRAFTWPIEKSY